jgi:hypothetical protein
MFSVTVGQPRNKGDKSLENSWPRRAWVRKKSLTCRNLDGL